MTSEPPSDQERLDALLRLLGHNIRDPLNTIKVIASYLTAKGDIPESSATSLERVVHAVDDITLLVNDLIDFARCRSRVPLRPVRTHVDLHEICVAVRDEAQYGDRLTPSLHREGESIGWADGTLVRYTLESVLRTLEQHGAEDAAIRLRDTGSTVTMEINADNIRLPESGLQWLTEPAPPSILVREKGSDCLLGLFLALEILQAHGGTMAVESHTAGTRVSLLWPRPLPKTEAPRSGSRS